jgi:hypothetical protein
MEVIKEAISKRESVKMCDSSLTLSKMKFTLEPEFKEVKFLEKTKSGFVSPIEDGAVPAIAGEKIL